MLKKFENVKILICKVPQTDLWAMSITAEERGALFYGRVNHGLLNFDLPKDGSFSPAWQTNLIDKVVVEVDDGEGYTTLYPKIEDEPKDKIAIAFLNEKQIESIVREDLTETIVKLQDARIKQLETVLKKASDIISLSTICKCDDKRVCARCRFLETIDEVGH